MWVVEDADVARGARPPTARRPQVAVGGGRGGGLAGHDGRGRSVRSGRVPRRRRHGATGHPRWRPRRSPRHRSRGGPPAGGGLGLGGARHVRAVPGTGGRPRARAGPTPPWPTCAPPSPAPPSPWSWTPTASTPWAPETRSVPPWPRVPDGADRGQGGGRRCSPPTTGSSPAWPVVTPGADRITAASALAARCGAVVLLKGADDGRRRPGRERAAGHGGLAPTGHGGNRRRAVGRYRGVRGPRCRAASCRRAGGARPRPGRRARPAEGLVAGDLAELVGRGCPRSPGGEPSRAPPVSAAPEAPDVEVAPGVGRDRPRCRPSQRRPPARGCRLRPALCAVVKADAYGHGAVAVARAALEGGASWLAVATTEEGVELRDAGVIGARSWCCPSRSAPAMVDAVTRGLALTLYTRQGVRAAAGHRRRPGRSPTSTSRSTRACTGSGAERAQLLEIVDAVAAEPSLRFAALWTHFPVADGVRRARTGPSPRARSGGSPTPATPWRAPGTRRRCSTPPIRPEPWPTPRLASTWCGAGSRSTGCPPSRWSTPWWPPRWPTRERGGCGRCCRCVPR